MSLERSAKRRGEGGYTIVELMMGLALFIAGMLALIGMQRLQARANGDARTLAIAQRIAETWASQLQMESLQWQDNLTTAQWLGNVDNGWARPAYQTDRVGAAFDALGRPLKDTEVAQARFCTNIRLTYLFQPNVPTSGNGLMRAEIRVFWLRDGEEVLNASDGLCPTTAVAADMVEIGKAVDRYEFVYQTTGLRQHSAI
jgi:Tfp pilus assembly protein PilV